MKITVGDISMLKNVMPLQKDSASVDVQLREASVPNTFLWLIYTRVV